MVQKFLYMLWIRLKFTGNCVPITIVDYGVGNIEAILNMLEYIGEEAIATGAPEDVAAASKLVLPGVGAFDSCMGNLRQRGLVEPLTHAARQRKVPLLGICVGMQMLAVDSEEGAKPGLGWIDGSVVRIRPQDATLKVPHVGWAEIHPTGTGALFPRSQAPERFYFVHSYHFASRTPDAIAATAHYGTDLCVAVSQDNIHGVQFHPEKSHRFGMRLLKSFAEL